MRGFAGGRFVYLQGFEPRDAALEAAFLRSHEVTNRFLISVAVEGWWLIRVARSPAFVWGFREIKIESSAMGCEGFRQPGFAFRLAVDLQGFYIRRVG